MMKFLKLFSLFIHFNIERSEKFARNLEERLRFQERFTPLDRESYLQGQAERPQGVTLGTKPTGRSDERFRQICLRTIISGLARMSSISSGEELMTHVSPAILRAGTDVLQKFLRGKIFWPAPSRPLTNTFRPYVCNYIK